MSILFSYNTFRLRGNTSSPWYRAKHLDGIRPDFPDKYFRGFSQKIFPFKKLTSLEKKSRTLLWILVELKLRNVPDIRLKSQNSEHYTIVRHIEFVRNSADHMHLGTLAPRPQAQSNMATRSKWKHSLQDNRCQVTISKKISNKYSG